jgi:hypothetical protein
LGRLPRAHEEAAPGFVHIDASGLPMADAGVRLLLGEWRTLARMRKALANARARGRFPAIAGETESIPLPGNGLRVADYP